MWCSLTISARQVTADEDCKVAVAAEVTDKYYGDDCYIHQLAYSITSTPDSAIAYGVIERSYDKGATWTTVSSDIFLNRSAVLPIMLPFDKETVRYRITAVPTAYYVGKWSDRELTSETSDYDITLASRIRYNAQSVVMNTGAGSGKNIDMVYLGFASDGCQVWGCQGIDKYMATYWKIDGGEKVSLRVDDFYSNTDYVLPKFDSDEYRRIPEGTGHYHFIKVLEKEKAHYFTWYGTPEFHPYGWYLCPTFEFKPTADIYLDENDQCLKQNIQYTMKYIDGKAVKDMAVMASCDKGKTWNKVGGLSTGFTQGTNVFSNTETVSFSGAGNTVRYKIVANGADGYKVLAKDWAWTYETEDYPIALPNLNFSLSAKAPDLSSYAVDTRTVDTEVTWNVLGSMPELLDSIQFQYSTDSGSTWTTLDKSTSATGAKAMKLPVGYDKYLLRAVPCLKGKLSDIAILHQNAVSDTVMLAYHPEASLSVAGYAAVEEQGNAFRTVKLKYTLNDDLLKTCGAAYLLYSYDEGKSWIKCDGFEPCKDGEQTVTIDASEKQCKFRIRVKSGIEGAKPYCTAETKNMTF